MSSARVVSLRNVRHLRSVLAAVLLVTMLATVRFGAKRSEGERVMGGSGIQEEVGRTPRTARHSSWFQASA